MRSKVGHVGRVCVGLRWRKPKRGCVWVWVYEDRSSTVMGFLSLLSDQEYCTRTGRNYLHTLHTEEKERKRKGRRDRRMDERAATEKADLEV